MSTVKAVAGSNSTSVRQGGVESTARLAAVLARAFEDDPVSVWVFPDDRTRLRRLERLYRLVLVPQALRVGGCFTTTDESAVALWEPAGTDGPGLVDTVGLMSQVARVCGRHTPRALGLLSRMRSHRPHRRHAHLALLGTEPDRQGEGLGGLVLRETLTPLDRAGTPAYLEATTMRSRALYLRHGFVDTGTLHLPGDGPTMWQMWRDPA
ncbi:GNAT family N-acetyltransferase [Ornithinimicrobium faecis]|uniref:GNAT family N-acetyltransferase n=1 Tax=Ornithinimicrobium faecis TaxID=2934158 RepID=UPI0021197D4B|nr:GNAT family N-acetyltransferase [Ornithinimicrobium sp. HY1745]